MKLIFKIIYYIFKKSREILIFYLFKIIILFEIKPQFFIMINVINFIKDFIPLQIN